VKLPWSIFPPGSEDLSIEAFGKINSVPDVGLRGIRHHGAIFVSLAIPSARRFQAR
jgi:hypothetical protein